MKTKFLIISIALFVIAIFFRERTKELFFIAGMSLGFLWAGILTPKKHEDFSDPETMDLPDEKD